MARYGELRPISQLRARVAWARPITSQAIAQMNPTNSRATAVVTTHFALPALYRCRYRVHSRFWAAQAMACTAGSAALALHLKCLGLRAGNR